MKAFQYFVLFCVLFQKHAESNLPRFPENFTHSEGFTWPASWLHEKDTDRIVGGIAAQSGQFPYQLSLGKYSESKKNMRHFCGASIVDETTCVTAAHCVSSGSTKLLYATAGVHSLENLFTPNSPECYAVTKILVHEKYNSNTVENDIALLKVAKPFSFTKTVDSVQLPEQDEVVEEGKTCIVSGFGTTEEGGSASKFLMHTSVPVISNEECKSNYATETIADSMMCAGLKEGGKDSCQGDSGGPMVIENKDGTKELVGIVSWGYGCARPGYPGVYTRVSSYRTWIDQNKNFDS